MWKFFDGAIILGAIGIAFSILLPREDGRNSGDNLMINILGTGGSLLLLAGLIGLALVAVKSYRSGR